MKKSVLTFTAVLAAVFVLYFTGLPHTVQTGDTGELVADALLLKIPHPPGYPLYVWIYHAFLRVFPWGSVFYRAALLTSMLSVGALACLLALSKNRLLGVAVILCLATSGLYWRYSLLPDVFSLGCLLAAAFLALYLRKGVPSFKRNLLASVLAGLGMSNHLTFVFICPLMLHLLWQRRSWKESLACGLAGATVIVTLYGSLLQLNPKDPYSWGSLQTPRDVVGHFLREDYSRNYRAEAGKRESSLFIQEAMAEPPTSIQRPPGEPNAGNRFLIELRWGSRNLMTALGSAQFWQYLGEFTRQLLQEMLPLFAFAMLGLGLAVRRRDAQTLAMGGCLGIYCFVMFSQIKIIPTEPAKAVVERFNLLPQVLIAAIALRTPALLPSLGAIWNRRRLTLAACLLGFLTAGFNFMQLHRANNLSRNTIAEDYAFNFLRLASASEPAIILANNDTMYFTLRYAQQVHGRNPGALVLSLPLLHHPWYVSKARMILPSFTFDEIRVRERDRLLLEEDLIRPNLHAHSFYLSGRFFDSDQFKLTHLPLGRRVESGIGEYFDERSRPEMEFRSGLESLGTPLQEYDPYRDIFSEYAYFDLALGIAKSNALQHQDAIASYQQALDRVPYCLPALQGVCAEIERTRGDFGPCQEQLRKSSLQVYDYFRFILK